MTTPEALPFGLKKLWFLEVFENGLINWCCSKYLCQILSKRLTGLIRRILLALLFFFLFLHRYLCVLT